MRVMSQNLPSPCCIRQLPSASQFAKAISNTCSNWVRLRRQKLTGSRRNGASCWKRNYPSPSQRRAQRRINAAGCGPNIGAAPNRRMTTSEPRCRAKSSPPGWTPKRGFRRISIHIRSSKNGCKCGKRWRRESIHWIGRRRSHWRLRVWRVKGSACGSLDKTLNAGRSASGTPCCTIMRMAILMPPCRIWRPNRRRSRFLTALFRRPAF